MVFTKVFVSMSEDLALSEMIRINLKNMLFQIHNKIY